MKKILIILLGIISAVHCFSLSFDANLKIDPTVEKKWADTIEYLLKNFHPFQDEDLGWKFESVKNKPVKETLEHFFTLGTQYQKELSSDPNITNVNFSAYFRARADISTFEFKPAHTNLNCWELFELIAKETTNTFCYEFNSDNGCLVYQIRANQRVDPTVKTPVESGKEQGTAGHP